MKRKKMCFWKIKDIGFVYLILAQLTLIQSCSNNSIPTIYKSNKQEQGAYQKIGIDDLLTKPEEYANKLIEITGVYKSAVEESALYLNSNSLNNKETSKAIWIRFDVGYSLYKNNTQVDLLESYKEFEKIGRKKIKIRGRFYPDSKGHLSSFFGTIGNVVYLEVLN
jgi:hypothetical protein